MFQWGTVFELNAQHSDDYFTPPFLCFPKTSHVKPLCKAPLPRQCAGRGSGEPCTGEGEGGPDLTGGAVLTAGFDRRMGSPGGQKEKKGGRAVRVGLGVDPPHSAGGG